MGHFVCRVSFTRVHQVASCYGRKCPRQHPSALLSTLKVPVIDRDFLKQITHDSAQVLCEVNQVLFCVKIDPSYTNISRINESISGLLQHIPPSGAAYIRPATVHFTRTTPSKSTHTLWPSHACVYAKKVNNSQIQNVRLSHLLHHHQPTTNITTVAGLLEAFGDTQPLPATLTTLDEIITDFIIETCHSAAICASYSRRQKIKVDDFKWVLRRDAKKLGRVTEIFFAEKILKDNRKAFDIGTGEGLVQGKKGAVKELGVEEEGEEGGRKKKKRKTEA